MPKPRMVLYSLFALCLLPLLAFSADAVAQTARGGISAAPANTSTAAPNGTNAVLAKIEAAIAKVQACADALQVAYDQQPAPPGQSANNAARKKYEAALAALKKQLDVAQSKDAVVAKRKRDLDAQTRRMRDVNRILAATR